MKGRQKWFSYRIIVKGLSNRKSKRGDAISTARAAAADDEDAVHVNDREEDEINEFFGFNSNSIDMSISDVDFTDYDSEDGDLDDYDTVSETKDNVTDGYED